VNAIRENRKFASGGARFQSNDVAFTVREDLGGVSDLNMSPDTTPHQTPPHASLC